MSEPRQTFDIASHHLWGRANIGRKVYISDMARLRGDTRHLHIGELAQLHDFVVLMASAPLMIGRAAQLNYGAVVQAYAPVQLCAGVTLGNMAQVLSGQRTLAGFETGPVVVGTGAIIGPGAVILPGSTVPAGACLQANEVYGAPAPSS